MKLGEFIQQASDVYDLGLDDRGRQEVQRRIVSAGYSVRSGKAALLDAILQTADSLRSRSVTTAACLYSGMKVEAAPDHDGGCPRCHAGMVRVALVNERRADYCKACMITLPIKA